jgi:hypothetical protein
MSACSSATVSGGSLLQRTKAGDSSGLTCKLYDIISVCFGN